MTQDAVGGGSADSGVTADAPSGALFPFPLQAVTARRQLRLAVVAALTNARLAAGTTPVAKVDSPGDWPYPQASLPAVCVRSPTDGKQGLSKGNTDFTTIVEIDVRAAVSATTAEAAQDALEALWYQIEQAILCDFYVIQLVQKVVSVETAVEIKADGQAHLAGAIARFRFETFETFDISVPVGPLVAPSPATPIGPLSEVTVDVTKPGSNPPFSPQPGDAGLIVMLPED